MKTLLENIYKYLFTLDLQQQPLPVTPPKEKPLSNREKLLNIALEAYGTDPTPNDVQDDQFACVESLTTLLHKLYPDIPIMTYTPVLLKYLQKDNRFKPTSEFKEGNIILSPTLSGNGKVVGHVGLIGKGGKVLSNSSSTGLFLDKYDCVSWVQRYSKLGQLDLYLFELN